MADDRSRRHGRQLVIRSMVIPGQKISLDQLQTLAVLANEKGVPGAPYDFEHPQNPYSSGPGTWTSELARLRSYAYIPFRLFNFQLSLNFANYEMNYPSHPKMLVSGPWPVKVQKERTPPILNGNGISFGVFPTGRYRVTYIRGAMKYSPTYNFWQVNFGQDDNNRFFIRYQSDPYNMEIPAPGNNGQYLSQTECEAGNAGLYVEFNHTGGPISIRLKDEPKYNDNISGTPSPTFALDVVGDLQTFTIRDHVETGTGNRVYAQVPTFKEPKLLMVRSAAAKVTTTIDLTNYFCRMDFGYEDTNELADYFYYNASQNPAGGIRQTYDFKIKGINGKTFNSEIVLPFIATQKNLSNALVLTGPNATDCTIEIIRTDISTGTNYGLIKCSKIFDADQEFEVGLIEQISVGGVRASSIQLVNSFFGSPAEKKITLTHTETTVAQSIPAIDNSKAYTLTPPDISSLIVTSKFADADDNWTFHGFKFPGNQAAITLSPDAVRNAIWIAKTYPIGGTYCYQAKDFSDRGLNFDARASSVPTPDFPAVPTTCEFILPKYPVVRFGEQNFFAPPTSPNPLLFYGAFIGEIFIGRLPERNPDDVWIEPANKPALTIKLGTVLSDGTFETLQTVTLAAGENQKYLRAMIPVCVVIEESGQRFKLVYQASQQLDIQCRVTAAFNANYTAFKPSRPVGAVTAAFDSQDRLFTGGGFGFNHYPGWPILPDHYNDTEAILNLIPDV